MGVIGDLDGSLLNELRSNYLIPVVLIDDKVIIIDVPSTAKHYKLQIFVIVSRSYQQLVWLVDNLGRTVWWNKYARFLIVDAAPVSRDSASVLVNYMFKMYQAGILNVQCILLINPSEVIILDSNPFIDNAPEVWKTRRKFEIANDLPPFNVFTRVYENGEEICNGLIFEKTKDIGGHPLYFTSEAEGGDVTSLEPSQIDANMKKILNSATDHYKWFIDNIVDAMNATAVRGVYPETPTEIYYNPHFVSFTPDNLAEFSDVIVLSGEQWPVLAVTNHTDHMSQLQKIISVIDRKSQIGMCIVYVISFLFFKFFLNQAVVPAILNLVRLTCGTGLTTLPQNDVAPTIYLAGLLMYVVTMQGIFTGNLATLLTSTISYPNVETKRDIARLGYTLYSRIGDAKNLLGDPDIEGHFIDIPQSEKCQDYLLTDPLTVCVLPDREAIVWAILWNLHVSREAMREEYIHYEIGRSSPFQCRLEAIMRRWTEMGLRRREVFWDELHLTFVVDDETRKNVERRVMTMDDLGFAFVILGGGLICSFMCFIGEVVVYRIRSKIAKRRDRVRARLAWGVPRKKRSFFSSLNLLLHAKRLLSRRR